MPADIIGSASVCMARWMRGKSSCSSVVTRPTFEEGGLSEAVRAEVPTKPSPTWSPMIVGDSQVVLAWGAIR